MALLRVIKSSDSRASEQSPINTTTSSKSSSTNNNSQSGKDVGGADRKNESESQRNRGVDNSNQNDRTYGSTQTIIKAMKVQEAVMIIIMIIIKVIKVRKM